MIRIEAMQPRDAWAVAGLHQEGLSTGFSGSTGRHLLAAYYRGLSRCAGASGYVARRNDQVIGYVCGVRETAGTRSQILRRELLSLLVWGSLYALAHPRSLLRRLAEQGTLSPREAEQEYELRPIVVAAHAHGSGAAAALVERLFEDARERGYSRIHLRVEPTNLRARAFYLKMGLAMSAEDAAPDRNFLRFEREL